MAAEWRRVATAAAMAVVAQRFTQIAEIVGRGIGGKRVGAPRS